jgi:hypothetical protein
VTAIDQARVAAEFARGDSAGTYAARGQALEDLIAYIFGLVPGLELHARNAMNAFSAEEIDLAFWNDGDPRGLRLFDHIVLVECKNWSTPVGYPELAIFLDKIQSRGRSLGILIATCGITGVPEDLTRAHSVIARALAEGRELLVVTRPELEGLRDTDELVRLLKQKRAQLAVSGTIFVYE